MIARHSFASTDNQRLAALCGPLDQNLRAIEAACQVKISRRGERFRVEGDKAQVSQALTVLDELHERAAHGLSAEQLQLGLARYALAVPADRSGDAEAAPSSVANPVLRTRRSDLGGRTPNQIAYLRNILSHDITFGVGPAGTGKTFLAVACAVDALERSAVQRIVLTRPAVEAGERLGFLPGDLSQKVDPYLRPLYDALYDLMGFERVTKAFEKGQLEVAPLAFMRGRTLNHAFVILDEAQNTTREQMKMFLTRIGFGSKAVVTGDGSQVDLPQGQASGLADALRVLRGVRGIACTEFTSGDVVRHPLVARIVDAYDADTASASPEESRRRRPSAFTTR